MTRCHTPNNGIPGFPSYLIGSLPHCNLVGTHAKNIFLITDLPAFPISLSHPQTQVRFQASLGVQRGSGGGFSPSTSVFPSNYYSTNARSILFYSSKFDAK
jgi:hypothetical protein